jgi:hypothetical protein
MRNVINFLVLVLLIIWAIGFFIYSVGFVIHIVLALAVITFILKILLSTKEKSDDKNINP